MRVNEKATLKRVITLPLLVFYGVGTIVGAGIYALSGKIAGLSGMYAPFSFVVSGIIAAFVAFTYAELSSRFPKSAGEAVYVYEAFHRQWLTALVGWGIVLTGIVSAGVMARGFEGYLGELASIPAPAAISLFVVAISSVAIAGIELSVHFAVLVTLIEVAGIVLVLFVSREYLAYLPERLLELVPPMSWSVWQNILMGAFLAFYAFIGFEDMVNIAEEITEPEKNLPRGILLALLISTALFVLVALAAVLTFPTGKLAAHPAPFALFIKEHSNLPVSLITLISIIAISNGALVQVIMGARVMYGMAEKGVAPTALGVVHPVTRTPVIATIVFSVVVLILALWLPIEMLAKITSFVLLSIFALISLSLIVIKMRTAAVAYAAHIQFPAWVPAVALLLCLGLVVVQLR